MKIKSLFLAAATAAIAGAGLVAVTTPAAAYIVCNREGECWHVRDRVTYKPEFGVVIHEDNWKWGKHEKFKWHEHEGHGYWRSGIWVGL